jgi:formylglycine-generating enzyme required for sulfatase activity
MPRLLVALALAVSALLAPQAIAATQQDYDDCGQTADLTRSVAACTKIAGDPGETAADRAAANVSLGNDNVAAGQLDRAIAAYGAALKIDPQNLYALAGRAIAYYRKGDSNDAVADYRQFAAIDPVKAGQLIAGNAELTAIAAAAAAAFANRAAAPLSAAEEHGLKPEDAFQECTTCPVMVVIPAGSFVMGPSDGQRQVTFAKPFAIGRLIVTFDEWDACVAAGGCSKKDDAGWGRGSRPVIKVSWSDAGAYAAWLSKKTGKQYRLLSESEYEYAQRAGTTTAYYWGPDISSNNANCNGCGGQWDNRQTAPAGSFAANPFGLYDMAGNVWEWVEDCGWHSSLDGAPTDGSAWTTDSTWMENGICATRVIRGGSWDASPDELVSTFSSYSSPQIVVETNLGFRIARTLAP